MSEDGRHSAAPSPALAPPPGNPRFPLFDGLRGLAVLSILLFHSAELTARLGEGVGGRVAEVAGSQAVIVFFTISGFLLYRPFAAARLHGRPAPSLKRYFRGRALRILPGYWFVLTALAIFPGIVGVFSGDWWRYYGYLQLYSSRTEGQGIPVAWTLCVEVTYYAALPLWAALARRLRWSAAAEFVVMALVAAAGAVVQLLAARRHVGYAVGVSLPGQCTWLLIGMALGVLSVAVADPPGTGASEDWRALAGRLAKHPTALWAVGLTSVAGLAALVPGGGLFGLISVINTPQPLGRAALRIVLEAICVIAFALPVAFEADGGGAPRWLLRRRAVVWLGVISYSFYLWHLTVGQWIAQPSARLAFSHSGLGLLPHVHVMPTVVILLVTLAAAGALASASYTFVELPFLRRK